MIKRTGIKVALKGGFLEIPEPIMKQFKLSEGDEMELLLGNGAIILRPHSIKAERVMEQVKIILSSARAVRHFPFYLVDEDGENVDGCENALTSKQKQAVKEFLNDRTSIFLLTNEYCFYRLPVKWRIGVPEMLCLFTEVHDDNQLVETVAKYAGTMLSRIKDD